MSGEAKIYDCTKCYHPHRMERALEENGLIRIKGKQTFKIMPPRLKHRRDGRKYVSKEVNAWSSGVVGTGYVTSPLYVNPNRGENALTKTTIDIFLEQVDKVALQGIIGSFNENEIKEYSQGNFHIHEQYGDESCVWRPNQLLTWGRLVNNEFVALNVDEVIIGKPLNANQYLELVKSKISTEQWELLSNKQSKKNYGDGLSDTERLALRLFSNIGTMQRTEMENNNCFGLCLHQFGICIETRYLHSLDELCAYMVINRRDPLKERKQQAKIRLKGGEISTEEEVIQVEESAEETLIFEDED